jgi:hypothetical protein
MLRRSYHLVSSTNTATKNRELLLIFVASGKYSHMTLGVGHVGIVVGTTSHFLFGENPLGFEWGIHEFGDGICGFVLGLHTDKESLI